jgi:hypothetical protein
VVRPEKYAALTWPDMELGIIRSRFINAKELEVLHSSASWREQQWLKSLCRLAKKSID